MKRLLAYPSILGSLLVISAALCFSTESRAGNEGAHGGDGIYCLADGALNPLGTGYFMLDFVIMRGGILEGTWPVQPELWKMTQENDVLAWVQSQLDGRFPRLAADLRIFKQALFKSDGARQWLPVDTLGIRDYDQGLRQRPAEAATERIFRSKNIPLNCGGREFHPEMPLLELSQIVRREPQSDGTILYYYAAPLLDRLRQNGAIQVSYLAVHEWLRDYTENPEVIRRMDRMLHSTAMSTLDRAQLVAMMTELGF